MLPDLVAAEREHHRRHAAGRPSVTVAILTRNALPLIRGCVESILDRVRHRPTTLLIADTGSDDPATLAFYQSLHQSVPARGFGLAVVGVGPFHFGRNYNAVAAHVRTDYLLIQNNDTLAVNDYVARLARLLDCRKAASAGPRMLYPDGRIQHDGQHIFAADGRIDGLCGHLHLGLDPVCLPAAARGFHRVDGNTAAGCLVRIDDFRRLGGFDEGYADIFQDVDLMVRLADRTGRHHVCDRDAVLVHIDNASRLAAGRPRDETARQMFADRDRLVQKAAAAGWVRRPPPEPDFSVITLAGTFDRYSRLLDGLAAQRGGVTAEVIGLPNYHGTHADMFAALNAAAALADGKYLVFCHDDVIVPPDWLATLRTRIAELDAAGERWGVIGPAGVRADERTAHVFLDERDGRPWQDPHGLNRTERPYYPVDTLDELCLVTRRADGLRFSAGELAGFHFYGADLCLSARQRGLKCFAVDARCHHESDGMRNLEPESRFDDYMRATLDWHRSARRRGLAGWRTMSATGSGDGVTIFAVPPSLKPKYGWPLRVWAG